MLKGVAHGGGGDSPEDRYGIVVALSQLTQTLAGAEADSAPDAAAQTSATLLRAAKVLVFVKDSVRGLVLAGSVGVRAGEPLVGVVAAIAGEALASSKPMLVPDIRTESALGAANLADSGVASLVCVPMRVGESNVGAIVALSEGARAFSPSDVELLHVVASHAALAAWRTDSAAETLDTGQQEDLIRLADRKIRELSLLNQVSEAMSSTLDLRVLLDIALEQSVTAVRADAGSIMLVNEDTHKLEIVASRGLDRKWVETTSQDVGKSIAGWVAQHGESVLVTDAHKDSRFNMSVYRDSITSSASVPLKSKGSIIGVLNVNTRRVDRSFDERDLELLGTVAGQMAVAIDNARLYARVNRRTQQLSGLLQISKTVTSTLNLDEVLRRLSAEICTLFQLDVCVVLLLDELSGRLRFGHGAGLKKRRRYAYYDLAAPLAVRVKQTGRKLVLRDVASSPNLATEVSESEGLRAAVALPLRNHGKLIGVAVGFAREARALPKSQSDIMRPLGELAGVAIHNARVYRRKYRIAEMLQQRLVSAAVPHFDGLDIGCKLVPAREVGGDYYDFLTLGPRRVAVVVSDVAGSDVEAAEYTTMGKHVLRVYARECRSPAEVLTKTNDIMCADTSAEVFISSFYGVIDLERRKLSYANAGCEPGILCKACDNSTHSLRADGILLGIASGCEYQMRETELEPGDVIVLHTDGLTEASVGGNQFGSQAVAEVVQAHAHRGAQEIANALHDALHEFVHGRVTDDVAIVAVKLL